MAILKNLRDVCRHFGVGYYVNDDERTNQLLSKTVYKATECGAWARVDFHAVDEVEEVWTTAVADSINGPIVRSARRRGAKRVYGGDIPTYVRDFMLMDVRGHVQDMTWVQLLAIRSGSAVRVATLVRGVLYFTFVVKRPIYRLVFRCGSIVEGSEAEINARPVPLPCKHQEVDAAVEYVNEEAMRLWHEIHDTPSLRTHKSWDELSL